MKKLIIFDMDGTLIDTDNVLIHTWKELFDEFLPNTPYTDQLFVSFSGPTLKETIDKFFDGFDKKKITAIYNQRTGKYYDMYASLFEDEIKNLKRIKELGYKFAIVTNKNRHRTDYCLKLLGLDDLFDFAVCGDEVKFGKPDPEGLLRCMKYYKTTPKETIYVGDTDVDYLASKAAGIDCYIMNLVPRVYNHPINPKKYIPNYNYLYEVLKNEII